VKYATEMGSGAMIYIPSFIKIGSGIQKLIERDTQTAWRSYNSTFIFKNKIRQKNGKDILHIRTELRKRGGAL
jgi:hypothetical protein